MRGDARVGWWRRSCLLAPVLAACLAWAASAQAQPFVFVTNESSGNVSQYSIGAADLLSPLSSATVAAGGGPFGVAVTPDGKSVYVANFSDDTVSQYNIDPVTGELSPKSPATVATGPGPHDVAVTPDGKSAYVTNSVGNADTVSQYNIDSVTGALSPKTPATVPVGGLPEGVAVTPDGKSAYVANLGDDTVSQYNIDSATGALSPKTPATVAAGAGPMGIAVSPDGKSAYVTNEDGDSISLYSIEQATGGLAPKNPAGVVAGTSPAGVAVTPDGKSVYVANFSGDTVSQYNIDPVTGVLTPKSPATVPSAGAVAVAVSTDGKSAYVTNATANTVSQYNVDPSTGSLSSKNPPTVVAGTFPFAIAVSPLPALHSTAASVSCSPSVFAPGDATVCRATVTDTASSGQSTPTGTVGFTNSGAGTFFGSPCTLSGSGGSASCAVFFTSFSRGGRIIAAAYGGDATHSASSGFAGVTVVVPASTAGCVVFGHGRITAANGDKASFRALVAATPPRGVEFYRDHGPANAIRVVSTSVAALTCADDATKASVFGRATVNGAGSVEYRIDVQLTAWEWGKDTYRIRLSNGYDSGAQPIRHGDLDIRLRDSEHRHHDVNANH